MQFGGKPGSTSIRRYAALLLCTLTLGLIWPAQSVADVISGFMEQDYSHLASKTQDSTGNSTMNKGNAFTQKYNLMLNKSLFPLLTLRAGYLFESDRSWLTTGDQKSDSKITTSLPSADLNLGTPLLNASVGYSKRKESTNFPGTPSTGQNSESYHGAFNWRPEGLPVLSLNLERSNLFDDQRVSQDITSDRAVLSLAYRLKGIDLKYAGNYNDHTDRLQDVTVKQTTNSARATYSGQFFQDRVSLYSSYNFSRQTTNIDTSGKGVVELPIPNQVRLFKSVPNNNDPLLITLGPLSDPVSIEIGTATQSPPSAQNMGFDFIKETNVTMVLVSISPENFNSTAAKNNFIDKIVPLYTWTVYESADNFSWTPVNGVTTNFDSSMYQFQIKFDSTKTRYIKVVVSQLDPAAQNVKNASNGSNLSVTVNNFEALSVQGQTSVTSNTLNSDIKVRLLDSPSLFYDCSFYLVNSAPNGFLKWTLDNAILGDHHFNDVVGVSGRVAREDSYDPLGRRVAYVYNGTLRVIPLKTLSHTLAYSGRTESFQGKTDDIQSLYLSNTAELYRGVNVSLNGGASSAVNMNGMKVFSYSMNSAMNLSPRSDLSLNLNVSLNHSDQSGGGNKSVSSETRRADMGVTYRPFPTLYLVASFGFLKQTQQKNSIVQNYGVNWSPFPDGTLQFNFSYQENVRNINEEWSRLISPGLSWKITRSANLDLSYPLLRTTSLTGTTESETFSAILRMSF